MGRMDGLYSNGQIIHAEKWSYKDMLNFLAGHQNALEFWSYKTTRYQVSWQRRNL